MNASNWIEIIAVIVGGGGGGTVIAKLTRLAVAVENGAEQVKVILSTVQDHENRLNKGGL